jgi:CDP-diglyceride synthetase
VLLALPAAGSEAAGRGDRLGALASRSSASATSIGSSALLASLITVGQGVGAPLIGVTWLSETAASGRPILGRHPLAKVISPKTVEGAVAQLLVSILAAVAVQAWFFAALPPSHAVIVGALLGVSGQVGDLVESVLKRSVGTKDTGQLIPGHGGILDRVDSLLFNTPVLFYYASHGRILTS